MDIQEICKKYNITNYTINSDGSIDVDDNVNLFSCGVDKIPLNFNRVTGYFSCAYNKLTSLKGAPKYVGGNFNCCENELSSLKHCPEYIGGNFYCNSNKIITMDGCLTQIGSNFHCARNPIQYIYEDYIKTLSNIELFNEFKIIDGDILYMNRLLSYAKINNYPIPDTWHYYSFAKDGYIIK